MDACIVGKHFLSRDVPGPDSAFSLEPREFKAMVEAIRVAEKASGKVRYEVTERETAPVDPMGNLQTDRLDHMPGA